MTEHFTISEARCNHCGRLPGIEVIEATAEFMEKIRAILGNRPIAVNSWYRCEEWNRRVGGMQDSQHLLGKAVDFVVKDLTPRQVQTILKRYRHLVIGLGCYKGFTHVDRRDGKKATWSV